MEVLNEYLFFFDHGAQVVSAKYVSSLIELIEEHWNNIPESHDLMVASTRTLASHDGLVDVEKYYQNTLSHSKLYLGLHSF